MKRYSWHAVVVLLMLVGSFWMVLFRHPARPHDNWYTAILTIIATAALCLSAFMLWETEVWTVRSLGVFAYICGDAVLYWVVVSQNYPVISVTKGQREGFTDLAAAFFFVGSPLLFYGLYKTARYEWAQEGRTWREVMFPTNWPLRLTSLILFFGGLMWGTTFEFEIPTYALVILATMIALFIAGIIILERRTRP